MSFLTLGKKEFVATHKFFSKEMGDGENELSGTNDEWAAAVKLLVDFGTGRGHLDDLLEGAELSRTRWLVMETFRQWFIIEGILEPRLRRQPRPVSLNLIRLAVAECLSRPESEHPKVVHHAVETGGRMGLSKPEKGFVNGVLRKLLREGIAARKTLAGSHPEWMTRRWQGQFGEAGLAALLEWNQGQPGIYVSAETQPAYGEDTPWEGFYKVKPSRFGEALEDLEAGNIYVQDPFAKIPVELLDPAPGERVLDLCAAPGGKSRLIARRLGGEGTLVLVDKPGRRLERLRQNTARFGAGVARIIGARIEDLREATSGVEPLKEGSFDAVLIDVPCSNTGVMRKRPDVKVRLTEAALAAQAKEQAALLRMAAAWVRPEGRLVYSTCSLEAEENDQAVEAFLEAFPSWKLAERRMSLPWECGHDGGGAFLLTAPADA